MDVSDLYTTTSGLLDSFSRNQVAAQYQSLMAIIGQIKSTPANVQLSNNLKNTWKTLATVYESVAKDLEPFPGDALDALDHQGLRSAQHLKDLQNKVMQGAPNWEVGAQAAAATHKSVLALVNHLSSLKAGLIRVKSAWEPPPQPDGRTLEIIFQGALLPNTLEDLYKRTKNWATLLDELTNLGGGQPVQLHQVRPGSLILSVVTDPVVALTLMGVIRVAATSFKTFAEGMNALGQRKVHLAEAKKKIAEADAIRKKTTEEAELSKPEKARLLSLAEQLVSSAEHHKKSAAIILTQLEAHEDVLVDELTTHALKDAKVDFDENETRLRLRDRMKFLPKFVRQGGLVRHLQPPNQDSPEDGSWELSDEIQTLAKELKKYTEAYAALPASTASSADASSGTDTDEKQ